MPKSFHRMLALCLVLLWGPVTMCCTLEAAGWDGVCSEAACHSDGDDAPIDACNAAEAGAYQSSVATVKPGPVLVAVCTWLADLGDVPRPAAVDVRFRRAPARPKDWISSWQFMRRAAAPAHAPDSLIA